MTTAEVNSFTQGNFSHLFNRQLAKLNENARQIFAYSLYTQIRGIPRKTLKILLTHLASQAHEMEEQILNLGLGSRFREPTYRSALLILSMN